MSLFVIALPHSLGVVWPDSLSFVDVVVLVGVVSTCETLCFSLVALLGNELVQLSAQVICVCVLSFVVHWHVPA